ncbi:MAG TPA: proline--tRNA ligase, partial [Clostridia bacterium]|nr:proline--tRNA ligase [Clostridia bacterium]
TVNETPGFIKALWCGDQACEDAVKEKTSATARCIPFEQEDKTGNCFCCGKPAKHLVYWGKAY